MRRSKTAGRRQRDARLSIKNSINHALFIYRHPKRKVNARQRPIRGAFVYQLPTGEGLDCQHPYAKGIIDTSCTEHLLASILRGALACQRPARSAVASTSYARCLQAHHARGAGKLPIHEVLASAPYARCLKRPICRAYEAHPRIPGTNTKDAAGGTLLPGQTAKETAGALLVGQAPPPRNP